MQSLARLLTAIPSDRRRSGTHLLYELASCCVVEHAPLCATLKRSAAHLTFEGAAGGEIAFGALKGFLDVRYGARDGAACTEFSWQGHDDNDPACGRGWVIIGMVAPPYRSITGVASFERPDR